ncbi:MAG: hypothetical protein ABFD77_01180 [Thermotogota bacterium]
MEERVEKKAENVMVNVMCQNERKVVGGIELAPSRSGILLSSRVVWAGFRPVTEDYRLPRKMTGDGHLLKCPKCQGMLCISGLTKAGAKDVPQATRDEARERALQLAKKRGDVHHHIPAAGIDPKLMPITLGKTRVEVG